MLLALGAALAGLWGGAGSSPPPPPPPAAAPAASCVASGAATTCEPLLGGGIASTLDVSLPEAAAGGRYVDGQIFAFATGEPPTAPRNATVASVVSGASDHLDITPADAVAMAVAAAQRAPLDFVLFSEEFLYIDGTNAELNVLEQPSGYGPQVRACVEVARAAHAHVVCPFRELASSNSTQQRGPFFNSVVLVDRAGRLVGKYRKTFPTSEIFAGAGELNEGVLPGDTGVPVWDTDVGRVAVLICAPQSSCTCSPAVFSRFILHPCGRLGLQLPRDVGGCGSAGRGAGALALRRQRFAGGGGRCDGAQHLHRRQRRGAVLRPRRADGTR